MRKINPKKMAQSKSKFVQVLKSLYFYLVSFACVIVFIIGSVTLINTALQTWVFPTTGYYYDDYAWNCTEENLETNKMFNDRATCMEYFEFQREKQALNQRNRDISFGVAMSAVSLPIWILHMYLAKVSKREDD